MLERVQRGQQGWQNIWSKVLRGVAEGTGGVSARENQKKKPTFITPTST